MAETFRNHPVWKFCCSLKLAIVLASLATLLGMGGSLAIHFQPEIFGGIERVPLGDWLAGTGRAHFDKTWWLWLTGLCLLLLGLNTLCCFLDWLLNIRRRWRKTGEYLLHFGFVLVLSAFIIGSLWGTRTPELRIFQGQTVAVPGMPDFSLRLDGVEPVAGPGGRMFEVRNHLTLMQGEREIKSVETWANHPLLHRGLVAIPGRFGREPQGFRCFQPGMGDIDLIEGARLTFPGGTSLRVLSFVPDAERAPDGTVRAVGERMQNPAMYLELLIPGQARWRGWYFLRESLPFPLVAAGLRFRPIEPLFEMFSLIMVNHDPGVGLALTGALLMLVGTCLAAVSYFRKRQRGDRPEIT